MLANRRSALLAIGALVATTVATGQSRYTPDPGPHRVLTIDRLVLRDNLRSNDVPLKIYYPQTGGPYPVIIFSHGLYGSRETYRGLGEYWASHGYVCIHPSHDDSRLDNGYRAGLMEALRDPDLWQGRPLDISYIVSSFAEIERLAPQLKGKLNAAQVGVGGHSYGAYTAEAIAGATVQMPGGGPLRSFADKRVKAVVVMSPQGEGEMGLTRESWSGIHLPVLTMYGSLDFGSQRRTPDWRSQPFTYSAPGDKYDVQLKGATHMTFTGPMSAGAAESKLFQCAKMEALAFWDAFLKSERSAKQYLDSDELNDFCGGAARIGRK